MDYTIVDVLGFDGAHVLECPVRSASKGPNETAAPPGRGRLIRPQLSNFMKLIQKHRFNSTIYIKDPWFVLALHIVQLGPKLF